MQIYRYISSVLFVLLLVACENGNESLEPEPTPTPDPAPILGTNDTIYNGIVLPEQWPPARSYSSDIRKGMSPNYLINKPEIVDISVGRQLFVDDFLIEKTTLNRTFHYPEYHNSNPILIPDKEWEKMGNGGGAFAAPFSDGVWYDETDSKFKMWYMAGGDEYAMNNTGVTCYAESTDGIIWTKPVLNIVNGTNIVDKGTVRDASVVWLDKQESNSSQRYKMFQSAGGSGNWKYHYKTSGDGKTWRDNATPSQAIADRSTVYKNPFRNVWVWSMRHNVRVKSSDPYTIRARDYMENIDPVVGNKEAKADLKHFWFGPWPNEQQHPYYSNNDGSPGIYNLDATPYESIMLGFFSVWQGPENEICEADNVIKRNQIMIGYSRDGYSWYREDMNPFLPVNETPSAWNNGNLQSVVGSPIIVDDKLYFYLSGRRMENNNEIVCTGLALLRRDGFVSMGGTGELQTTALKFEGNHFFINANIKGSLKIELLNEKGEIISGFSKDECKEYRGDYVKQKIEWKNHSSLSSLNEKIIKIKFHVTEGEIFSFWISPSESGKSFGYTGGGGPGFDESGIDK